MLGLQSEVFKMKAQILQGCDQLGTVCHPTTRKLEELEFLGI